MFNFSCDIIYKECKLMDNYWKRYKTGGDNIVWKDNNEIKRCKRHFI